MLTLGHRNTNRKTWYRTTITLGCKVNMTQARLQKNPISAGLKTRIWRLEVLHNCPQTGQKPSLSNLTRQGNTAQLSCTGQLEHKYESRQVHPRPVALGCPADETVYPVPPVIRRRNSCCSCCKRTCNKWFPSFYALHLSFTGLAGQEIVAVNQPRMEGRSAQIRLLSEGKFNFLFGLDLVLRIHFTWSSLLSWHR